MEKSIGASLTKSVKAAAAAPGEPLSLYLETSFLEIMRVRREVSWWQFFRLTRSTRLGGSTDEGESNEFHARAKALGELIMKAVRGG